MIKNFVNFLNLFRVKYRLKKLKFKFYSDGPVKNLNEVDNLDLKKKIATEIINFNIKFDLFCKNISVNDNLKISGLWKDYLVKNKKEQIEIYNTKNINKIILLHENMFYNFLTKGLWSYSYFVDLKRNHTSVMLFLKDLDLYKVIFKDFSKLASFNKIKKWGFRYENNKFHFIDISSNIQKNLILNSLNLLNDDKKFNILEIGGGFGSLAERLFEDDRINSYVIVDAPSTLLIAYYYLTSKYGTNFVEIINSSETIDSKLDLKSKKIYLIPTVFFDELKRFKDFCLLCNFASFAEMNFDTVKYYLNNLPDQIKVIVSSNSNLQRNHENGFQEVLIDNFPIPKGFVSAFSTVQIPYYSNWRYKTKIWFKKNFIKN